MARRVNFFCVIVFMLNFSAGLFTKKSYNQFIFSETSTSKFPFEDNPKHLHKNGSNIIRLKLQIDNYSMLKCKCIESTHSRRDLKKTEMGYVQTTSPITPAQSEEVTNNRGADGEPLQGSQIKDDTEAAEMLFTTKRNASESQDDKDNNKSSNRYKSKSVIQLDEQALVASYLSLNTSAKIESSNISANTKLVDIVENKTNLMEDESRRTKAVENIKEKCPFFQNGQEINLDKMPGAWNIIYYQMPENLSCFKMLIRKTTLDDKKKLVDNYGDLHFNVDWEKCHLEILTESQSTRHYLQGEPDNYGVLRNIILTKNETTGKTSIHEETPDQWRLFGNLLVMRDCESGEIAAFMRNTSMPSQSDVIKGLHEYGIDQVTGKVICYAFPEKSLTTNNNLYQNPPKRPQETFDDDEDNEFSIF